MAVSKLAAVATTGPGVMAQRMRRHAMINTPTRGRRQPHCETFNPQFSRIHLRVGP
jgi:hypothetical protein